MTRFEPGLAGVAAGVPALSVVMPACNVSPYIDAAVESVLSQTFTDFELIVRDDGSTDDTGEKLRRWARTDSRIKLHMGEVPLGPAGSSNWVVENSCAPFVARLDADDVSLPDRFQRQIDLLNRMPEAVMVGALGQVMLPDGAICREPEYWRIARRSAFAPFMHSSIMFRRAAFDQIGGYRAVCNYWEDLDLYLRMARVGTVAVMADSLVIHRLSPLSARLAADPDGIETALGLMYQCLGAAARGEGYEPLLQVPPDETARIAPMVFVSLGSLRLWRGLRPGVGRRLWRRGRLRPDFTTVAALGWAGCAAISPWAARRLIGMAIAWKERRARDRVTPGEVYSWSPFARDAETPPPVQTTADVEPEAGIERLVAAQ